MRIAVVGGTHGNEPVGIGLFSTWSVVLEDSMHSFETFWANPKAFELGCRFVDSDLNRTFGKNGRGEGYEIERSKELTDKITGRFDFIMVHTTTSNMGITIILLKRMIQLGRQPI